MTPTLPGLDVLRAGLRPKIASLLCGARAGLLTNQTGYARDGATSLDVLRQMGVNVVTLFSPEHGPRGTEEGEIASVTTGGGLPVHSLYGATRRPTTEMLAGVDILVCDLQDVGARFYTYFATIAHCLEEAARHGVAVVILDRPNPLGGLAIEGPTLQPACRTFVGYAQIPVVHGLTMAELARWYVAEQKLKVELHPVACQSWGRDDLWPDTALTWRRPSPNLPDYKAASWYPALCPAEFSDLCVGRGTGAPFQILAAPWLNAERLRSDLLNLALFPELEVSLVQVTPAIATHAGLQCKGIHLSTAGPPRAPVALGLAILALIGQIHPDWRLDKLPAARILVGSDDIMQLLEAGNITDALRQVAADAQSFRAERRPILLYPETVSPP